MSKQTAVTFPHVYEKLFIVHLIVRGSVVQGYPGGVYFLRFFAFWFTNMEIMFSESLLSSINSLTCVWTRPPFNYVVLSFYLFF